jgi:hypothetical protein
VNAGAPGSPIKRVAMLGVGYMGTGIAQVLALAGVRCRIVDADPARTEAAHRACLRLAEQYAERGHLPAGAPAAIERGIEPAPNVAAAVADAELVLEAVTEDASVKRALLREAERSAPAHAILASNTSSITIASLAEGLLRPRRMYGSTGSIRHSSCRGWRSFRARAPSRRPLTGSSSYSGLPARSRWWCPTRRGSSPTACSSRCSGRPR